MNQCFCRGLAAAVVVSAIGAPLPANAEQVSQLEASFQASRDSETPSEPLESLDTDALSQPDQMTPSSQAGDLALGVSDFVQVIPHALDASQAATLYVSDIPVLTFVGQELETLSSKSYREEADSAVAANAAPENRAAEVARRVDEFYQAAGNPEMIAARWDSDLEEYVIELSDDVLVTINEETILPDTTESFAEDALQATNRLRRLLGGAEPLQAVAGQPAPQVGVAGDNWAVSSVSTGRASWYGPGFHGRRTASGEVFNQNALTAAHRTLPFGTLVRVTNLNNSRQVVVRINDRGPFSHGRILDLSAGAAREVGLDRAGVGPIRLEVLSD
ncbi:MAG: septal ring lytic transglycosylase RlpA family protein [Leptolyngbya sp. SIO1E4]|nr:septal ring lytic transglycosylase RlpA family protein [Leptolyngbya sp. SIO1E4]